jgi:hypothetical protein
LQSRSRIIFVKTGAVTRCGSGLDPDASTLKGFSWLFAFQMFITLKYGTRVLKSANLLLLLKILGWFLVGSEPGQRFYSEPEPEPALHTNNF